MSQIFVAGSITIKQIPDAVKTRISNMISNELAILVGDANGVDSALQRFLAEKKYARVCVLQWQTPAQQPRQLARPLR